LVLEAKSSAFPVQLTVALVALGLLAGCAERQPTMDLYLDAVMLRELDQDQLAVKKLNAVVAADPGFTLAYSELGKAYEKLGDHQKALAAFRKAAELDPWSFEHHMNLAGVCKRAGNYADAAAAYARASELDPRSADAMMGAAECFVQAGQYTKALVYCESAGQTGEKPQEIMRLLARVYEGQKDYERAVDVYKRLLATAGDDPDVMLSLALAHMKAGNMIAPGRS